MNIPPCATDKFYSDQLKKFTWRYLTKISGFHFIPELEGAPTFQKLYEQRKKYLKEPHLPIVQRLFHSLNIRMQDFFQENYEAAYLDNTYEFSKVFMMFPAMMQLIILWKVKFIEELKRVVKDANMIQTPMENTVSQIFNVRKFREINWYWLDHLKCIEGYPLTSDGVFKRRSKFCMIIEGITTEMRSILDTIKSTGKYSARKELLLHSPNIIFIPFQPYMSSKLAPSIYNHKTGEIYIVCGSDCTSLATQGYNICNVLEDQFFVNLDGVSSNLKSVNIMIEFALWATYKALYNQLIKPILRFAQKDESCHEIQHCLRNNENLMDITLPQIFLNYTREILYTFIRVYEVSPHCIERMVQFNRGDIIPVQEHFKNVQYLLNELFDPPYDAMIMSNLMLPFKKGHEDASIYLKNGGAPQPNSLVYPSYFTKNLTVENMKNILRDRALYSIQKLHTGRG